MYIYIYEATFINVGRHLNKYEATLNVGQHL